MGDDFDFDYYLLSKKIMEAKVGSGEGQMKMAIYMIETLMNSSKL